MTHLRTTGEWFLIRIFQWFFSYEFKAYEREILRTNSFFFSSKKILLPAVFADPIMQLKTLIVCCIFDFIRKYIN